MQAEDVDAASGTDAEAGSEFFGRKGDVAGGDIGLGVSGGQFLEAAFVQRKGFHHPEPFAEGRQLLYRLRADIKMRMSAQFAKAEVAGPVKGPGLEERLSRLEEETHRGPL